MPALKTGTMVACPQCGTEFYRKRTGGRRKYCGEACYRDALGSALDPVEAFWKKVDRRGDDECWGWKAQKRWDGYGRFVIKLRPQWAHRFSYELHHGPITPGMVVMHTCDNPECTNPKHLRLGTRDENHADKVAKRRHAHGETSSHAKLTDEAVVRIRREYWSKKSGNKVYASNARALAAEFGCSVRTIVQAVKGATWRHVQ